MELSSQGQRFVNVVRLNQALLEALCEVAPQDAKLNHLFAALTPGTIRKVRSKHPASLWLCGRLDRR
jgi:hypothetical protein